MKKPTKSTIWDRKASANHPKRRFTRPKSLKQEIEEGFAYFKSKRR